MTCLKLGHSENLIKGDLNYGSHNQEYIFQEIKGKEAVIHMVRVRVRGAVHIVNSGADA
jgi:hypothetical protein